MMRSLIAAIASVRPRKRELPGYSRWLMIGVLACVLFLLRDHSGERFG
jgi:hypothetical protein